MHPLRAEDAARYYPQHRLLPLRVQGSGTGPLPRPHPQATQRGRQAPLRTARYRRVRPLPRRQGNTHDARHPSRNPSDLHRPRLSRSRS
ncbi:hypothetical protein BJY54_005895 [Streptomyces nodosus]|nr:hypothetical protein [Streptomyces nodosus]